MSQNICGVYSSAKGHFHRNEGLGLISISYITHNVCLASVQSWKMFLILNCVCTEKSGMRQPNLPPYSCVNIFRDPQSLMH